MNKVLLIIQREYLARVRKKSFIVMTFLVPGLILAMYGVMALLLINSDDLNRVRLVNVVDESGVFAGKLKDTKTIKFISSSGPVSNIKADLKKDAEEFLLFIPSDYTKPNGVEILSQKKPNFSVVSKIEEQMNDIANANSLVRAGIDTAKLHQVSTAKIAITSKQVTEKGVEDSSVGAAYGAAVAGAILIYISLFIYGSQVMRGVIEEKTNRIIEVVVSSVKPFQLMLGKIIGVGAVGLTQFLLWIALSTAITVVASNFLMKDKVNAQREQVMRQNQPIKVQTATPTAPPSPALDMYNSMKTINYGYILSWFIFYFLTGYMLYSALFAAVGSAVDSETETQQFMFPITLPLLFTYILSFSVLVNNPDSSLAFWLSVIPFTAPVAMMVRLPFSVPGWQLALSAFMMIAGFLFTTWVASRIYRVGILMYGKKTNFREISKWFFYKE